MSKEVITTYNIPSEAQDAKCINISDAYGMEIIERLREKARECSDITMKYNDLFVSPENGQLMRFSSLPLLEGNTSSSKLTHTAYAFGQLLTYLRIPRPYYKRCPSRLRAENFNYWIREKGGKKIFVRKWNDIVRAFFTTRFTAEMDDVRTFPFILELLEETNPRDSYSLRFVKTPGITSLVIDFNDLKTREVDGIEWALSGGLRIINSEVGLSSFRVMPHISAQRTDTNQTFFLSDHTAPGASRFKHVGEFKRERILSATRIAMDLAGETVATALAALVTTVNNPEREVERLAGSSPFITDTIIEGIAESLNTQEVVTKGDIISKVILAAQTVIPFTTRMNELLEIERKATQYLGFMVGLEEQLGTIIARAADQKRSEDIREAATVNEEEVVIEDEEEVQEESPIAFI